MTICVHPLDEVCAFLGALGFIFALFGLTIGIGQYMMDSKKYVEEKSIPGLLYVGFIGAGILIMVLILGWINTKLPASCISY